MGSHFLYFLLLDTLSVHNVKEEDRDNLHTYTLHTGKVGAIYRLASNMHCTDTS